MAAYGNGAGVVRTTQQAIDDATMRLDNPALRVVGSGYIEYPPQRPFQDRVITQPPTISQYDMPELWQQTDAAAQQQAAARAAAARQQQPRQPPPPQPQRGPPVQQPYGVPPAGYGMPPQQQQQPYGMPPQQQAYYGQVQQPQYAPPPPQQQQYAPPQQQQPQKPPQQPPQPVKGVTGGDLGAAPAMTVPGQRRAKPQPHVPPQAMRRNGAPAPGDWQQPRAPTRGGAPPAGNGRAPPQQQARPVSAPAQPKVATPAPAADEWTTVESKRSKSQMKRERKKKRDGMA